MGQVTGERIKRGRSDRAGSGSSSLDLRDGAEQGQPWRKVSAAWLDSMLAALDGAHRGEFSARMPAASYDAVLSTISTKFNELIDCNQAMVSEISRVERVVRRGGRITERASLDHVSGGWGIIVKSINSLISGLVQPTLEVARVINAVAAGDLTQRMELEIDGEPVKGEFVRIGRTVNAMVDQLSSFAVEVTRVAREVGTAGKLGGQAQVKGVSGTWKELTDSVNLLANNLTTQVRNIADVTTSVARGDLSRKITVDASGEILELKNTINTMVDQLSSFASEVSRVAREVGTEGRLGGQAEVRGVSGIWKELTDNVNLLANNLTAQVRNIADVTTAVANGDLSEKITVSASGEVNELKTTINDMVDQLRSFASEVTRVAREVGTDGKLGGQADVKGVSGVWKDLTDNVNVLAGNLTDQVRNIANVTTAVANGDLSQKISVDVRGEILELKNTMNTMVDQLRSFASEVTRVAREVGTDGKLGGQADVRGVSGVWKDLTDNVNSMASNLTGQVRAIAKVTTAVANGDLSQKITVDVKGEILELKNTINTMVDQLNAFASEVTRVAREVGTEGKLGGQAQVPGVAGIWKDLTDSVNFMASNLTAQVRGIIKVVTAVAEGDLGRKLIGVQAQGEIAALAETINGMTYTLAIFADQVSTVAREVGIEGNLGGQAKVPGASGTWRMLVDNVNQLTATLTSQVRAISEVATAVAKGDLSRSIMMEAKGEIAALKDNINQMIINLRQTTRKNNEQDWLKGNLARFSAMMQGQKNLNSVSRLIMSELTPLVSAHYGAIFLMESNGEGPALKLANSYAYPKYKGLSERFRLGEGLVGQCAAEKKPILVTEVPSNYIKISSGLGEATPLNIIVLPTVFEDEVKAVIELASFHPFSAIHQIFLNQLSENIGVVLNTIMANMRTEQLLQQSQNLTQDLQLQSHELTRNRDVLQRTNAELEKQALELEEKARQLQRQNAEVEIKNREVEQARLSLEDKAEQLSLVSRYKSEFLANMSHELRTPLNSMMVLARVLAENRENNLSEKQLEYVRTIDDAGNELLKLVNDVLDLSKVESGKMQLELREVELGEFAGFVQSSFLPLAETRGLEFLVEVSPAAPVRFATDPERLQQVIRNLLSNAFKFTEHGGVRFAVSIAPANQQFERESLRNAGLVLAFSVADTGIGIPREKHTVIFEAFQQADGTTARQYGGTGLGLSISREIARVLGGEIQLRSSPGEGSTFTLFLPVHHQPSSHAGGVLANLVDSPERETPDIEGTKVLIVDDDIRNMYALSTLLMNHKVEVLQAEDGRKAIEIIDLQPDIDLVLMDIMMPEVDGYETMRAIRMRPDKQHLPVIALTAKALPEDRERCMSAGASEYLSKPIDSLRLIELIALWTGKSPARQGVEIASPDK